MPNRALVDVARYVHRLSQSARDERAEALRATHGYMDEAEAKVFEEALSGSRRIAENG